MEFLRTLYQKVSLEGVGVFSGQKVRVEILPNLEGEGIIFVRADLNPEVPIPLHPDKVIGLEGATAISDGEHSIYLIEHLLSALHGLGIDSAIIKVYGEEIPLFDGSALPFVKALRLAGYRILSKPCTSFYLKKELEVKNGVGCIRFRPSLQTKISVKIHFPHPLIGEQRFSLTLTPANFLSEVSFARTFGFKALLEERKREGILKGGDLTNAIVLDEEGIINPEGLRCADEFVRHKALDLIGDLYILGKKLRADVEAEYSTHKLHVEAIRTLWASGLLEEVVPRSLTFFLWQRKGRCRA